MTTHETLVSARNKLAKGGWRQWRGGSPVGDGNCILGGFDLPEDNPSVFDAWTVLKGVVGTDMLMAWNDAPRRTKEEVFAALDEAIARTAPPPPDLSFSELVEAGSVA